MVNVRFANYEDFLNFVRGVPDNVKRILYKAYPEYTKRLMDDVFRAFNSRLIGTSKSEQAKVSGTTQPKISTTKPSVSSIPKSQSKILNALGKTANGLGALAKRVAPAAVAIGEYGNITNPNNPMNSRILSGAGAALPFLGGPVGWVGGGAALLGSAAIRNANQWANQQADRGFEAYQERYGTPEIPYAYDQAPGLRQLTPEQQDQVLKYQQKQIEQNFADMEQQVAGQQKDLNQLKEDYNASQKSLDELLANTPEVQSLMGLPQGVGNNIPQGGRQIPIQTNNQTRAVQNAQQPRLNGSQVLTGGDIVNSPYNALQLAQNLSQQNRLAAIANFNQLQDLINQEGNTNMAMNAPVPNQQQANPAMSAYLNAMAQQQAQREANALAQEQFYQQALQDYRQAAQADAIANFGTNLANISMMLGQNDPRYNTRVMVGPTGTPVTIPGASRPQLQQFTPTNRNVNNFNNRLALQQAQLKAKQAGGENNLEALRDVVVAEALGNQYGMNPMVFLNPDLATQLLKNQGTLENTRVTGEERRKDITPNTLSELAQIQAQTAGNIDLANVQGMYNLQGRDITGQYGVQQAQVQGLNNYQNQLMQQQFLNQRLQAELVAQAQQTEREIQSRLQVAKQYGMNQRDLAAYEQQLRASDPMQAVKNAIQYTNAASYYTNPDDAARMYYQALQMFGGNNQAQLPTGVVPSIGATLTPQQQAAILKRMQ